MEKSYEKPFEVHNNTTILFGKFKGKPHSVLLDSENKTYLDWLMDTEESFAEPTKVYIRKNQKKN